MTDAPAPIIEVTHLDRFYGDFHALKDINLTVRQGGKMVICGPSHTGPVKVREWGDAQVWQAP